MTEVFLFEEDCQAVTTESQDDDDDQGLTPAGELSLQSRPESSECFLLFVSLLNIKDGAALNALGSPDVLVMEEAGTDVVVEISPPVTSAYRHWNVLWYNVPLGLVYNIVILIKL